MSAKVILIITAGNLKGQEFTFDSRSNCIMDSYRVQAGVGGEHPNASNVNPVGAQGLAPLLR